MPKKVEAVIVRSAKKDDQPKIRKLIALYPRQLLQKQIPKINYFFVAEKNGAVIGCCALEVYSQRIAEIRSLAVKKSCRGRGIGTALLAACFKRARKKRIREIFAITGQLKLLSRFGLKTFSSEKFAVFKILRES